MFDLVFNDSIADDELSNTMVFNQKNVHSGKFCKEAAEYADSLELRCPTKWQDKMLIPSSKTIDELVKDYDIERKVGVESLTIRKWHCVLQRLRLTFSYTITAVPSHAPCFPTHDCMYFRKRPSRQRSMQAQLHGQRRTQSWCSLPTRPTTKSVPLPKTLILSSRGWLHSIC